MPAVLASTISGSTPEDVASTWTVLYHIAPPESAFKGRAEFLKIMLEDAAVDYHFTNKDLYGPDGYCDMFRDPAKKGNGDEVKPDTAPFPVVYPPVLWHRPGRGEEEDVMINQVSACMAYLGAQLGYRPSSAAARARADCITANAVDYIASGRSSFHPVEDGASFHTQKDEGESCSKLWAASKMGVWLQHFEKVIKRAGGKPLAGGEGLTCADFAVFHVLDATEAQFNNEAYGRPWDSADIPASKAFKLAMEARPNLAAYFASERRLPWAGDSMM